MKCIPFFKYTNCGNSFVIVDEISQAYLAESEKPLFAEQASDANFGIGSDGLIVIQSLDTETLIDINNEFGYWDKLPSLTHSKYIFRLFESNMKEALACGNGLLCAMRYLHENYRIKSANIMTEIPLQQPNNIHISYQTETNLYCCNLGYPRRLPKEVTSGDGIEYYKERVDIVYDLKIGFRSHDLHSFAEDTPLLLSGYLIFTGEPHLIIFPDECMPPELSNTMFISREANEAEKRKNFGSWLVNHVGAYINKQYRHRFPLGINVNFARIHNSIGTIQYRTYERGVDRETLACGTGAAAVAHVAKVLEMTADIKITSMLPVLAYRHSPDASLDVTLTENGILLKGLPSLLFNGSFRRIPERVQYER